MKTLKYSRQREAISEFLDSRTDHPSADMVYENVKREFPNISLGTVYRNLNLLVEIGQAARIVTKDGFDRFDAKTNSHYHFTCTECGSVNDLPIEPINNIEEKVKAHTNNIILGHEIVFFGICEECESKRKAIIGKKKN